MAHPAAPLQDSEIRELIARHAGPQRVPPRFKIITDTSDFFRVEYNDVVVLGGVPYWVKRYEKGLMTALACKPTVKKQVNVLLHLMGYFKKVLSPAEKAELLELIDQYHREYVPLLVPLTLLNHYVRKYNEAYLADQYYLQPHPVELKLRNHV